VFVAKVGRFPYTIALLLVGLAVSVLGATAGVGERLIDVRLTHDLIFLVLLPPLLFEERPRRISSGSAGTSCPYSRSPSSG